MEVRAAVATSHRLLDEMALLQQQLNQNLTAVRDSALTLKLNMRTEISAVHRSQAAPVAEPVVLAVPTGAPEPWHETRLPDVGAPGVQPLDPRPLAPEDQMRLDLLTRREIEVLRLIGEGHRTKEIAFTLGITFKTAVTHRSNIMEKLGIHEGPRLVRFAIRTGITTA